MVQSQIRGHGTSPDLALRNIKAIDHMGPTMAGQQVELGPCPLVAQYDQA